MEISVPLPLLDLERSQQLKYKNSSAFICSSTVSNHQSGTGTLIPLFIFLSYFVTFDLIPTFLSCFDRKSSGVSSRDCVNVSGKLILCGLLLLQTNSSLYSVCFVDVRESPSRSFLIISSVISSPTLMVGFFISIPRAI